MDQEGQPGPSDTSAATVEAAGQVAASSLQLVAMLEVVHDWDRGDVSGIGDFAKQAETLWSAIDTKLGASMIEVERVLKRLEAVVFRAERLALVAPVQARDDALGGAMASALRRLAAAGEELRTRLAAAESEGPSDVDTAANPGAGSA